MLSFSYLDESNNVASFAMMMKIIGQICEERWQAKQLEQRESNKVLVPAF